MASAVPVMERSERKSRNRNAAALTPTAASSPSNGAGFMANGGGGGYGKPPQKPSVLSQLLESFGRMTLQKRVDKASNQAQVFVGEDEGR